MKEVMLEMVLSEITRLSIETRNGFAVQGAKMDAGFKDVKQDLKLIRDQTAHLTERVTLLEEANV